MEKLSEVIKEVPAWSPARDASNNVIDGMVLFDVEKASYYILTKSLMPCNALASLIIHFSNFSPG
jgi:hypothetical protein